jgi:hypothetical protein
MTNQRKRSCVKRREKFSRHFVVGVMTWGFLLRVALLGLAAVSIGSVRPGLRAC